MTYAVVPHPSTAVEESLVPRQARQPGVRRRLVLIMVGTAGPMLTGALDNSLDAMVEQIFGHPRPELIAKWRKIHEFFNEPRLASLLTSLGYA
jgi:hypothetical protein